MDVGLHLAGLQDESLGLSPWSPKDEDTVPEIVVSSTANVSGVGYQSVLRRAGRASNDTVVIGGAVEKKGQKKPKRRVRITYRHEGDDEKRQKPPTKSVMRDELLRNHPQPLRRRQRGDKGERVVLQTSGSRSTVSVVTQNESSEQEKTAAVAQLVFSDPELDNESNCPLIDVHTLETVWSRHLKSFSPMKVVRRKSPMRLRRGLDDWEERWRRNEKQQIRKRSNSPYKLGKRPKSVAAYYSVRGNGTSSPYKPRFVEGVRPRPATRAKVTMEKHNDSDESLPAINKKKRGNVTTDLQVVGSSEAAFSGQKVGSILARKSEGSTPLFRVEGDSIPLRAGNEAKFSGNLMMSSYAFQRSRALNKDDVPDVVSPGHVAKVTIIRAHDM